LVLVVRNASDTPRFLNISFFGSFHFVCFVVMNFDGCGVEPA
jgi:hypothetical protein